MKKILVATSLMLLALCLGCKDVNSILPPQELDLQNRYGSYHDTTFYAVIDTFLTDYRVDTGSSSKLSVGNYKGFGAGFFLKFTNLPDTSVTIDSVFIQLTGRGAFGDAENDLLVNIYEPQEDWTGSANTEDKWHNTKPAEKIGTTHFYVDDSIKIIIKLDNALFEKWRTDPDQNRGLYFSADQANYIKEINSFFAIDPLNAPRLYYKEFRDSLFVLDSTNISQAATIFDYNANAGNNVFEVAKSQNDLLISSGIASRILLKFEGLEQIPEKSIIEDANLSLQVDDRSILDNSKRNKLNNDNHGTSFYLRVIDQIEEDLSSFQIDSAFANSPNFNFSMNVSDSANALQLVDKNERVKFGNFYVQRFLNGNETTQWFYLQYKDEGQDISVMRFSGIPDTASRPLSDAVKQYAASLRIRYYNVDRVGL